jgi:hypothetical protein
VKDSPLVEGSTVQLTTASELQNGAKKSILKLHKNRNKGPVDDLPSKSPTKQSKRKKKAPDGPDTFGSISDTHETKRVKPLNDVKFGGGTLETLTMHQNRPRLAAIDANSAKITKNSEVGFPFIIPFQHPLPS